jgi:hypothetical protein
MKLLVRRVGGHLIHGAPDSLIPVTMDGLINRGTYTQQLIKTDSSRPLVGSQSEQSAHLA